MRGGLLTPPSVRGVDSGLLAEPPFNRGGRPTSPPPLAVLKIFRGDTSRRCVSNLTHETSHRAVWPTAGVRQLINSLQAGEGGGAQDMN